MKRHVPRSISFAIAMLALLAPACAVEETNATGGTPSPARTDGQTAVEAGPGVDVDNKTITVGNISALSGPVAVLGEPVRAGMDTYWESVNESGGIDGWEVKLLHEDSGYETQRQVQLFNEIKGDVALLSSFGTASTNAVRPLAEREGIVIVPQGFDSEWGQDELIAPIGTPAPYDVANALDYVTEQGSKDMRVGIIYQNDDVGADGVRGFKVAQEEYGFTDVGQLPHKPGDTDFTAQVQQLKSAEADAVVVISSPSASGPIVGTAASLGFQPQWVFLSGAFTERLMTEDGTQDSEPTPLASALDGTLVAIFAAPWGDTDFPGMARMMDDVERFAPDKGPSVFFTLGYVSAMVQEAILRHAIELGDLSRDGVLEAKLTVGEIDLGGLAPDVNYTRDLGPPSRSSLIQVIDPEAPGFLETVSADHMGEAARAIEES